MCNHSPKYDFFLSKKIRGEKFFCKKCGVNISIPIFYRIVAIVIEVLFFLSLGFGTWIRVWMNGNIILTIIVSFFISCSILLVHFLFFLFMCKTNKWKEIEISKPNNC